MRRRFGFSSAAAGIALSCVAMIVLLSGGCGDVDPSGLGPTPDSDASVFDTTPGIDAGRDGADTCSDHALDGNETDVDCGGACPNKCSGGQQCRAGSDCKDAVCTGGQCAGPTCSDGVKNGSETDVDCGGACPNKCADAKGCGVAADCQGGVCKSGTCALPTCSDGVKNGSETDTDCGGSCPNKCGTQQGCKVAADCQTGACSNGRCIAASCTDGTRDGTETDVDCGGPQCNPCGVGKGCGGATDCTTGVCNPQKICAAASCTDGIRNGNESDVDCGGSCPPCADGKRCGGQTDCTAVSYCSSTTCTPKLGFGAGCSATFMCTSGNCADGVCCDTPQALCGACRQCNLPTSLGHCINVPVNQDPHLVCSAGGTCKRTTCAGDGTCNQPDSTACGAATCASATETDRLCSGGACNASLKPCGAYVCSGNACATTCADDAGCANGFYCAKNGSCQPVRAQSAACNPANDCASPPCRECATAGGCVDGFCCNAACGGGSCDACAQSLGATANGTCTILPAGAAGSPACAPYVCGGAASCPTTCITSAECIAGDYCDATSHCAPKSANGTACTSGTQCASNNCVQGQSGFICSQVASCLLCQVTNGTSCIGATAGSDPKAECGTGPCVNGCNGAGACAYRPNTFVCSATTCSSGQITGSLCTGSSAACPAPATITCPGNLKCLDATTCRLPPCGNNGDCETGSCGGGGQPGFCG